MFLRKFCLIKPWCFRCLMKGLYLRNPLKNKEYCISSNFTRLHGLRFIDFKNIDDFLNIFEELTIKKKEFKLLRTKDGGFEYGKIAAKVAV